MAQQKKRDFYKGVIIKAATFIDHVDDDVTEENIATHFDRCTDAWRMFQDIHLEILEVTGDEFLPFQQTEFDAVESIAMKIIPQFKSVLRKFHTTKNEESFQSAHSSNDDDVINRNNGGLRVRYFKIPLFSGDNDAWPAFKDLFRSMIHINPKMSSVQKLGYLKVNLSDEALKLIKNLEITNANYDTAWALLTDRYDNERILVNRWIQLIFNIPVSNGSAAEVKAILDGTQEAMQGLKNLNRPIEHYDDFLVHLTETKLDQESKQRWEDDIAEIQNTAPKWDQMVTFLKTRFRALEVSSKPTKSEPQTLNQPNNAKSSMSPKNTANSPQRPNQEEACLYCKKRHRLTMCFAFQKIP